MNHAEKALADRVLAGHESAVVAFVDAYFPGLYRFALARMDNDADEAEDVVQTTLCAALSKLHTYRGEASLFTWLCTFCRHEISAHFRRMKRWPQTVDLAEDSPEVRAALESLWAVADEGPEGAAERKEISRLVQLTLDQLPGRYGEALAWKYIEGIPVNVIADRLGSSPKAAESLLTRARQAFRDGFSSLMRARGASGSTFGESC